MRTFYAFEHQTCVSGSFVRCQQWAKARAELAEGAVVKIALARGGEKQARIIAEQTLEGFRFTRAGRTLPVDALRKASCQNA